MRNLLKSLALTGTLALTGCSEKTVHWTEADINKQPASVEIPLSSCSTNQNAETFYAYDLDGDGKVDMIGRSGFSHIIYPGYEKMADGKYAETKSKRILTDEMREAASKVMNDQREFMRIYTKHFGIYDTNSSILENK